MAPQSTTDDGITRLCAVTCSHSGRRLRHYVFAFLPRVEGRGRAAVAQFRRDRRPGCSERWGFRLFTVLLTLILFVIGFVGIAGLFGPCLTAAALGALTWSSEAGAIGKDYCRMEKTDFTSGKPDGIRFGAG
jgi:hypothetical protein